MSGVLLSVGVYAILRFKPAVDAAAGPGFARGILLALGVLSVAVAAAFPWTSPNYKRMLAYSSVEHIGLVCLGLGFGGTLGTSGALLHIANHAPGQVDRLPAHRSHPRRVRLGRDRRRRRPDAQHAADRRSAFLAAMLALVGLPPFGLFVSEVMIFGAGFAQGFACRRGRRAVPARDRLRGPPPRSPRDLVRTIARASRPIEASGWRPALPVAAALALLLLTGLAWPPGLGAALDRIVAIVVPLRCSRRPLTQDSLRHSGHAGRSRRASPSSPLSAIQLPVARLGDSRARGPSGAARRRAASSSPPPTRAPAGGDFTPGLRLRAAAARAVGDRARRRPGRRWPASPRSRHARSRPAVSSARSTTCSAWSPKGIRIYGASRSINTGQTAITRCAATPYRARTSSTRASRFPFRHVEGEGIFEITVGPVHAGIIEPGHFRFSVEGETIVNLETRLGFVHKGTGEALRGPRLRPGARARRAHLGRHERRPRPRLLPGARDARRLHRAATGAPAASRPAGARADLQPRR